MCIRDSYKEKPRPFKLLETGVRVIDTVNPIVEGGTGFIPGPFGTGKTVLQHAISKQAEADIVIIAACGERANEVVEIFTLIKPKEQEYIQGLFRRRGVTETPQFDEYIEYYDLG